MNTVESNETSEDIMIPKTRIYYKSMGNKIEIDKIEGCIYKQELEALKVPKIVVNEYLAKPPYYYRNEDNGSITVYGTSFFELHHNEPIDIESFEIAIEVMKDAKIRLTKLLKEGMEMTTKVIEI